MRRVEPNPEAVKATNNFVAALCAYVTRHGGVCYQNWSPETLDDYFRFHLVHGTLAFCRKGANLCGVMVAWQTTSERLDSICPSGRVVFDWTPHNPAGDCVWVADVVTTAPKAWLCLARCFAARYPHWLDLPLFTYRAKRGHFQRHQLPVARILKLPNLNPQSL